MLSAESSLPSVKKKKKKWFSSIFNLIIHFLEWLKGDEINMGEG